ncbi:hypothetical protein [Pseudoramibacter alactolyticus]|uniref:hypothetical protein n=2 Tax=Pseudoramibacter alactolyticus TaxID=113287 RepID=UPI0023545EF6|nr:hypothetical protein [Pseudoramibacter alactolyticus]
MEQVRRLYQDGNPKSIENMRRDKASALANALKIESTYLMDWYSHAEFHQEQDNGNISYFVNEGARAQKSIIICDINMSGSRYRQRDAANIFTSLDN